MDSEIQTEVLIIGGGFAGLRAAKELSDNSQIHVTLIDKKNHHLFQPLLYQVATAGLSPADIAMPIRSILSEAENVDVVLDEVREVDLSMKEVRAFHDTYKFDYLIMACGATQSYFGKNEWEKIAPGLKTVEDATQIRAKILLAFEEAEISKDPDERRALLNFVLVGGGPTGVELAGSIAELSQQTLTKDFKHVDLRQTQVTLVEAGPRLLAGFDPSLSDVAKKDLEDMGVHVLLNARVTDITPDGVQIGDHLIRSRTVVWSAGVQATQLKISPPVEKDRSGRLNVKSDLSLPEYSNAFVCGDMAHFAIDGDSKTLPGLAAVAMQQGVHAARMIQADLDEEDRSEFRYRDKGIMATIGRKRAVMQMNRWRMSGLIAWLAWLVVHIYYLIGFRNRVLVLFQWAWAYLTFKRGARLIVEADVKPHETPSWHGTILHT